MQNPSLRELFERIHPSLRDYLYFAAVLNDIHLKEQDMIDGAWNHHPSLVLRNELLES